MSFEKKETYSWLRIFVFIISTFFVISDAQAQHQAFRNFSTDDGLPQSQVIRIHQDQRGYIWLGTTGGGVSRFDGNTFWSPDTTSGQHPFNVVKAIVEDTKGILWFGTEKGLFSYDGFHLASHNDRLNLPEVAINSLYFDHQERLWIGTNKGLYAIDDPNSSAAPAMHILPVEWITTLEGSATGSLWIGTMRGVFLYTKTTINTIDELSGTRIFSLAIDNSNTLWIGSNKGVWSIKNDSVRRFTPSEGLPDLRADVVYVDSKNTVWAGTRNGIARLSGHQFTRYITGTFDDDRILSILEDNEGNYWYGVGGKGIFLDNQHAFTYLQQHDGLPDNIVWSVNEVKPNTFWIGTKRGLALFEPPNKLEAIYPDIFDGKDINDIHVDRTGRIWIATHAGVYLQKEDQFELVPDLPGMPAVVLNIDETENILWFHTVSGLIKYTDEEASLFDIKTLGGLPSAITQDKHGDHWLGTRNGLLKLEGNNLSSFSAEDGLNTQICA